MDKDNALAETNHKDHVQMEVAKTPVQTTVVTVGLMVAHNVVEAHLAAIAEVVLRLPVALVVVAAVLVVVTLAEPVQGAAVADTVVAAVAVAGSTGKLN